MGLMLIFLLVSPQLVVFMGATWWLFQSSFSLVLITSGFSATKKKVRVFLERIILINFMRCVKRVSFLPQPVFVLPPVSQRPNRN